MLETTTPTSAPVSPAVTVAPKPLFSPHPTAPLFATPVVAPLAATAVIPPPVSVTSSAIHTFVSDIRAELANMARMINIGGSTSVDRVRGAITTIDNKLSVFHAGATRLTQAPGGDLTAVPTAATVNVENAVAAIKAAIQEGTTIMQAQIQALVTALQPLLAAVTSVQTEIQTQTATISKLNAQVAAGTPLGPDDVAALNNAANAIQAVTATLASAAQPVAVATVAAATASSTPVPPAATVTAAAPTPVPPTPTPAPVMTPAAAAAASAAATPATSPAAVPPTGG